MDKEPNDNNSLNLNNYCGANEFYLENSGRTREFTGLNSNNSISSISDGESNEGRNSSYLFKKRVREISDIESDYISEDKSEEIDLIINKEDLMSSLNNFENYKNKKEDITKNKIEKKEECKRGSSENKKENEIKRKKLKEDEKKIVFKISKTIKGEEKKYSIWKKKTKRKRSR